MSTYKPCHDDNLYFNAFAPPSNIVIAGSKGYQVWPDCDLIVNLDAINKPMVGVAPPPPPTPPRPLLSFSNKDWSDLLKYVVKPAPVPKKEIKKKPDIIDVLWPDMKTPLLSASFWIQLYEQVAKHAEKNPNENYEVLFTCTGGHGRTGTSMCCFLVGSGAYDPLAAIQYVREHYCKSAVENMDQEDYLWSVGAAIMEAEGHEKEVIATARTKYKAWVDKNYKKATSGYVYPTGPSRTPSYNPAQGSALPQVWDYKENKWVKQDDIDREIYM